MSKKNIGISIIGSAGIPSRYGGFETLVENLTKELSNRFNIIVYCSSKVYKLKKEKYNNAHLKYINLNANGFSSILYDIISIIQSYFNKNTDVLLVLGTPGMIILPIFKIFSKKPVLVNIDGLEWKRDKWSKIAKLFLLFSEKIALKYADFIICDNQEIINYCRKKYKKNNLRLISYGSDHVNVNSNSKSKLFYKNYALKVCRIEKENNIELVLKSFSKYKKFNLIIIGNWNKSKYSKNLYLKYKSFKNIKLLNPIYDQDTLDFYRKNSSLYIHGHSAGGTNPSLIEAMRFKKPIICYDVIFNRYTTNNKSLFFKTIDDLIGHLVKINMNKLDVKDIAESLYNEAEKNYKWELVSKKYEILFHDCIKSQK